MEKDISPSSENELNKVVNEAVSKAANVNQKSIDIQKSSQHIMDQGNATIRLNPFFDDNERNRQLKIWSDANNQLGSISSQVDEVISSTDYAAGTASISSASAISFLSDNKPMLSSQEGFLSAFSYFEDVVHNESYLFENIINKLKIFGLDKASGKRQSPLALFMIAISTYNSPAVPDSPAITSLIPLRESISSSIEFLLKSRPRQEKTGHSDREKIISIGNQLKKGMTSPNMVFQWADQWHKINDEDLSDSKQSILSRYEWTERLFRAAHFYNSFLTGLDPSKLRKT